MSPSIIEWHMEHNLICSVWPFQIQTTASNPQLVSNSCIEGHIPSFNNLTCIENGENLWWNTILSICPFHTHIAVIPQLGTSVWSVPFIAFTCHYISGFRIFLQSEKLSNYYDRLSKGQNWWWLQWLIVISANHLATKIWLIQAYSDYCQGQRGGGSVNVLLKHYSDCQQLLYQCINTEYSAQPVLLLLLSCVWTERSMTGLKGIMGR